MRKKHSAKFKANVALEAIKGEKTLAELSCKYSIHRTMIQKWKTEALAGLTNTFSNKSGREKKDEKELISELYRQIGKLKVENDWLKKIV
jgi:transposase-like protein